MFSFWDLLFTPRCIFCGRIIGVGKEERICPYCHPERYEIKPPFCPLCGRHSEADGDLCESCQRHKPGTEGQGAYLYDGLIRDSLHRFKYEGCRDYGRMLGKLLWQKKRAFIQNFNPDVFCPVPLHKSRLRERGYNQAEELCKALSRESGIPYGNLLKRTQATTPQMSLNALMRSQNLAGVFEAVSVQEEAARIQAGPGGYRQKEDFSGDFRKIMLVDDIFTTGSTVGDCTRALKEKYPEVEVKFLTFAMTAPPQNRTCEEKKKIV